MAEMSSWFRGRTPRARSPSPVTSSFEHGDRLQTPLLDNEYLKGDNMMRERTPSRVSSLLTWKGGTPALPQVPSTADAAFANVTDPDNIWYNPNIDQMVETMMTVMMTKPSAARVPAEYNYCILHILEGYRDLKEELEQRTDELEKLKTLQDTQVTEFEKLGLKWARREKDYKSEMKKLEVILANGPQGLEAVSLARSRSVINDKEPQESIEEAIQRIKSQSYCGLPDSRKPLKVDFGTDKDIQLSQMLARGQMSDARLISMNHRAAPSTESRLNQYDMENEESLIGLGLRGTGTGQPSCRILEDWEISNPNTEAQKPDAEYKFTINSTCLEIPQTELVSNDKPLPEIPAQREAAKNLRKEQLALCLSDKQANEEQNFSFTRGDELEEAIQYNEVQNSLSAYMQEVHSSKSSHPVRKSFANSSGQSRLEDHQAPRPPVATHNIMTPKENSKPSSRGVPGRGVSNNSVAASIRNELSESTRKFSDDTAKIAAQNAAANRIHTD